MEAFLPINAAEAKALGGVDFWVVTGDAYVDHPSFGASMIARYLEHLGYKVGIIAQPDIKNAKVFAEYGMPRLAFLVTSGNIDSMVNNYSVAKKKRNRDSYSPGGKFGARPDRALTVYCKAIRRTYPDAAIIIGGLEASLRRLAHYDYWSDSVRPSVLVESGADICVYGMGELAIKEIAALLERGVPVSTINNVRGTVVKSDNPPRVEHITLPEYQKIKEASAKQLYADSYAIQYENNDPITAKTLVEPYDRFYIIQNPPQRPLTTPELDAIHELKFTRRAHPSYTEPIPAIEEISFSLVSVRGCFGGCSFCALNFHQGRIIQARSHDSLVREAEQLTRDENFKGYIHDVGGPTANFRQPSCKKQLEHGTCPKKACLYPSVCKQMDVTHTDYLELLRKLRALPKVKKVFVRSGIRFDYLIADKDESFFKELVKYHVSGQLKVAPEHISDTVLRRMGKPTRAVYEKFAKRFRELSDAAGLKQYLVPYLISSHPGSTLKEAIELAEYLRDNRINPEQVQDFYPTPGSLATCMYYTGIDARNKENVYVPKSPHEKALQRALLQYRLPQNYDLVYEALTKAGRTDLIGFGRECLIRPRGGARPPKPTPKPEKPKKKRTIRNIHKKKS